MSDLPDSPRTVFSATIRERNGTCSIKLPPDEVAGGELKPGDTYRVAVFGPLSPPTRDDKASSHSEQTGFESQQEHPRPPVGKGEVREVTIEAIGNEGDGIAKVERGYVVIVPNTHAGQQPIVEIGTVKRNVAFASVVTRESRDL